MNISVRRTRWLPDYLFIRSLRNKNRSLMTGYTGEIGLWQQIKFWFTLPINVDLYIIKADGKRAGYMLLKDDFDTTYITECVEQTYRGMGLGIELVKYAQNMRTHLTADIQATNVPSLKLHAATGFRLVKPGPVSRYVWY